MKVQALILVLLVPWFVHAEPQYYGTRVTGLALSGTESQDDLQLIQLKIGDLVTPEGIRAAIQALYNTGRYSSVEVDAAPAPAGGTNLTFIVRPYYFFSTFRLVPKNLLERSLSAYSRLPFGEKFSESTVNRIIQETTDLLKSEGYFEATITPRYDFGDATRLVSVTLTVEPGPKAKVADVRIQGGEQTFPPGELQDALGLDPGDDFSSTRLEMGVTKVREKFTNLGFLNTRVRADQPYSSATHTVDLNVTVEPGQFTLVQTRGYNISSKTLRGLVPVFEEGTVDQDLVEEGRVGIDRYLRQQGYFEAEVTSEIIEAPLDNAIQINYTIVPGVRHKIEGVRITGNTIFTTEEIRNRVRVRKGQLFNRGVFSPDLLDEDVRAIEALYRNAGYEGTTVVGAYDETKGHVVTVVLQIEEGKQLSVDLVGFVGNFAVSEQELRDAIQLKEGDIYTPPAVDQARAAITQLYFSRGFPDVRVEQIVNRIETNNGMGISFQISEGDSYTVGRVLTSGNTLTREKIIRRYSKLQEGMPYNPEALLESQQRLYATGLFNRVEIVQLQQNLPGIRNLLIQVEDAQPIQLTYGLGYQEFERVRGTVEISHTNLFGLNRSISVRARGSRRERLAQSTFHEPWLFNHELDGFASTFVEHTERPFFSANRIDFSLQVLKRFSVQHNLLFTSSYQTVNLQDIRVNRHVRTLPPEQGPCQICQIARFGTSFIQDRRNDALNPSTGSFSTTTLQFASRAFGSELNFTSLFNQSSFYAPAPHGVLATSFRLGWNHTFGRTNQLVPGQTQKLPPTERYFAGGSATLRGFGLDEAGPIGNCPPPDEALRCRRSEGGNLLTIGNIEYRFPLRIFPVTGVGGALFYDTGNVFPSFSSIHLGEFTHTVGFGLRYQTAVGPVRLDFGINLKPELRQDKTPEQRLKISFTLGNPF
jgi:outer membrane protein assembly complex protein YaeT